MDIIFQGLGKFLSISLSFERFAESLLFVGGRVIFTMPSDCGAFSGMENLTVKRNDNTFGFGNSQKHTPSQNDCNDTSVEVFSRYGFLPELIGRFSSIAHLNPLGKKDLMTILKKTVLPKYKQEFKREGNKLSLPKKVMENIVDKANGKYIWPLEVFYGCIRKMCPELPLRIPLPLERCSRHEHAIMRAIFQGRVSEKLLLKVEGSTLGAEVLFNYMEVRTLLKAVSDSQKQSSDIPEKLYADLNRILSFKLQQFEAEFA